MEKDLWPHKKMFANSLIENYKLNDISIIYTKKKYVCQCQLSTIGTYTIIHFFGGEKVLFHEDLQQCNNSLGI